MRLEVLGCSGGELPGHRTTCFLVDGTVAIDAGALTTALTIERLMKVQDIVLTHSHLDHVKDVPLVADLLSDRRRSPLRVHASPECARTLRRDLFNDRLWPDFTRIPSARHPVLRILPFDRRRPFRAGGLTFTAVPVSHPVESMGFIVSRGRSAFAVSGDTGPTSALWRRVREAPGLKALLVEVSFPDRLQWVAEVSGHLTPRSLAGELAKLARPDLPILLYHLKPTHVAELRREVRALHLGSARILKVGDRFTF
jgi:cAMP phosphodiesterase